MPVWQVFMRDTQAMGFPSKYEAFWELRRLVSLRMAPPFKGFVLIVTRTRRGHGCQQIENAEMEQREGEVSMSKGVSVCITVFSLSVRLTDRHDRRAKEESSGDRPITQVAKPNDAEV